jgi:hypothetical protein
MKGLVHKELRDVLPIAAVALLCYLGAAGVLIAGHVFRQLPELASNREPPFVGGEFLMLFAAVSVLFALALGLRQSAWDELGGRYLFLLHRPISRNRLFLTRLAIGAGVLVLCAGMPILVYGAWAAIPGAHPSPFAWSMTLSAWHIVYLVVPFYLGAFLCGLYPARWFGTRLLPLVAITPLLFLAWLGSEPLWYLTFPAVALLAGLLVAGICYVARERDYA